MQLIVPKTHRWTRAEFTRMGELGWFHDQQVELIDGEIIDMPPPGNAHCISNDRAAERLRDLFRAGYWVRMQMPLNLGPHSEPLPDVAVVEGARDSFVDHPTTAVLIVEVSDSTLAYDRRHKASLYARAGIADYWIINLPDHQLEVRRNPVPDSSQPHGFAYADETVYSAADQVAPLVLPRAFISVADLLP
jgi:Uma2 family endonuclease